MLSGRWTPFANEHRHTGCASRTRLGWEDVDDSGESRREAVYEHDRRRRQPRSCRECSADDVRLIMTDTTATNPNKAAQYEACWKQYRRLRRRAYLPLLAFVSCVALAILLPKVGRASIVASPVVALLAGVALASPIAAVLYGSRLVKWPCPECGKAFHSTAWGYNSFSQRCLNCGFRKWARQR